MGHDGIWNIVDRFSKHAHFVPVRKKITADQIAQLFMQHIFKYHGILESTINDRDPWMTCLFWKGLFENMGTTLHFSSTFHQQTNGQSQQANSTILDSLKCYVHNHQSQWE